MFSKRREAIEEYARSSGRTTGQVGQEAAFETRRAKRTDINEHTLLLDWRRTANGLGLDPETWRQEKEQPRGLGFSFLRRKAPKEPPTWRQKKQSHANEVKDLKGPRRGRCRLLEQSSALGAAEQAVSRRCATRR